jgi:hypothetical protein
MSAISLLRWWLCGVTEETIPVVRDRIGELRTRNRCSDCFPTRRDFPQIWIMTTTCLGYTTPREYFPSWSQAFTAILGRGGRLQPCVRRSMGRQWQASIRHPVDAFRARSATATFAMLRTCRDYAIYFCVPLKNTIISVIASTIFINSSISQLVQRLGYSAFTSSDL